MSFDTTARVTLSLDQLLEMVDQLSDKEAEKVAERLALKRKKDAVARMSAIMGKVKMSPREVARIVEDVRQDRYDKRKAREAGR
jgi:Mn-dependent DtxR family transcriptional regulator